MRILMVVLIGLMLGLSQNAFSALNKIGFGPYSSATAVTCSAVGGIWGNNSGMNVVPAFNPIPSTIRTLSLGTKTFRNYTTSATNIKMVYVSCYQTSDPQTPVVVKMFFDGVTANTFPISNMFLYIKQ